VLNAKHNTAAAIGISVAIFFLQMMQNVSGAMKMTVGLLLIIFYFILFLNAQSRRCV
jgi:hypothetical protein